MLKCDKHSKHDRHRQYLAWREAALRQATSPSTTPAAPRSNSQRKDSDTGQSLIEALQSSPHRDIEIEPSRDAMPVRDVVL